VCAWDLRTSKSFLGLTAIRVAEFTFGIAFGQSASSWQTRSLRQNATSDLDSQRTQNLSRLPSPIDALMIAST
jgi:hypothetical protein